MKAIIDAAFSRTRTVLLTLVLILIMGLVAWSNIPKEAEPDVAIPIIYVSMTHEGISPEDAERLLVRPMEKELQNIEGIKEMRAQAVEGFASVTLEFDAGFDADKAMQDVREKVDIAKAKLPQETDEPRVNEVNVALFPVLTVVLSGPVPERTLVTLSRDLKDQIEALPGVLEVDIGGNREEVMEAVVDPTVMETYNVSYEQLFNLISRNNMLVAAGALDTGAGRLVVKVPGVIEDVQDVLNLPVKVAGNRVVTFKDVAQVRRTFKDPEGFARVDGQPALTLEVSKRVGANIIQTIDRTRQIVDAAKAHWPGSVKVAYLQDKSKNIKTMLSDLENNVVSAIILVMIVIIAALGLRPAILVGLSIPGSFLAGIMVISGMGYTLNIVVLFSLILVVGMLVDGAIVIVEYADRKMAEGAPRKEAYAAASKRMAWPVIASTATTLAVFLPLVVWPGVVGEFMKYLPITVLITLLASLFMALIFIPVLGGLIGKTDPGHQQTLDTLIAAETGDLNDVRGLTGIYTRTLGILLRHPGRVLGVAVLALVGAYIAYWAFGRGVEFFPKVEPEFAQVQIHARGDLSVWEKDAIVRRVEHRILGMPEFKTVYARTLGTSTRNLSEDTIGVIQLELIDWQKRRRAVDIIQDVRQRTADIPGIMIEVREQDRGPSAGKPVQLQVSSRNSALLDPTVERIRDAMEAMGGFVDLEDSRPLPGIEWRIHVDREKAARYGADVAMLGNAVRMVTNGIKVADYRPDDADEEVDIRVRFPNNQRSLESLDQLRVPTQAGLVPITNFVSFQPAPKTGAISRSDGHRVVTIGANVKPGLLVNNEVKQLKALLAGADLPSGVSVHFKGEDEDQREAGQFLGKAFGVALFLMALMLVTQFNSIYQSVLVLSAIVFSTAGVFLGLLVTGQPFGIVMGGIGVIALAGIVVNNNIILIDTFNELKGKGMEPREAILRTGAQRLRPVLLTSFTTVLGLLPMVLALNIDLIGREVTVGSPSTQWWTQLSSAIAGGLTFATMLTLLLTPCLLMLGENVAARLRRRREG